MVTSFIVNSQVLGLYNWLCYMKPLSQNLWFDDFQQLSILRINIVVKLVIVRLRLNVA